MSDEDRQTFSDAERGDTLARPARHGVRVLVFLAFVAVFAVVILVGKQAPAAVASYLSGAQGVISAATPPPSAVKSGYPVNSSDLAQARLVERDDEEFAALARTGAPKDPAYAVTVLPVRASSYGIEDLVAAGALRRDDVSTLTLVRTVFVARGATLELVAPGQTIRMTSGVDGYASFVNWGGSLVLSGSEAAELTITSWNPATGDADVDRTDGRAYIRSSEGGTRVARVAVNDLGFWSGRTGGFALTGSLASPGTGSVTDSSFRGLHLGTYLSSTSGIEMVRVRIESSIESAIVIDRGSHATVIADATISRNAVHGIEARPGSSDLQISGSTLSDNGGYGVRADGSPMAEGANVGGFSVANSAGFTMTSSTVSGNRSGGVAVIAMSNTHVQDCTIRQQTVGVLARDSQGEIVRNSLTVTGGNGIVLDGAATAMTVSDNTINGEGYAPIAIQNGATEVNGAANVTSGWSARFALLDWVEAHPLALLWGLLLIIPIAGLAFIAVRRRRQRKIRELVESTVIAMARSDKERYEGLRAGEVVPSTAAPAEHALVSATAKPTTAVAVQPAAPRAEPSAPERSADGAVWLIGGPAAARDGSRIPINPRRDQPARVAPPTPPKPSPRPSPPPWEEASTPPAASGRAAAWNGRFASVEELAVAAVLEGGKPIDSVARTLRLPVGSVAGWVAKARRLSADADSRGDSVR